MKELPLFPVTTVGSWPRPPALLEAQRQLRRGSMAHEEFDRVANQAVLDVVEDKVGFERLLQTLDVPAYSISNPTCVGRISAREPLAIDDLRSVQRYTDRAVKVTLPGPYLLTRAMFVAEVTQAFYPTKEDLAEDVVALLRAEVVVLAKEGAD